MVEDSEIHGKAIHDRNADTSSDREAETEVLSLGVGCARRVGKHEADAGFQVRDDRPSFLDEVVAGPEEAASEPGIGAVDDGGIHAAEEEFRVAAGPTVVADLIQLPAHRDQLG